MPGREQSRVSGQGYDKEVGGAGISEERALEQMHPSQTWEYLWERLPEQPVQRPRAAVKAGQRGSSREAGGESTVRRQGKEAGPVHVALVAHGKFRCLKHEAEL